VSCWFNFKQEASDKEPVKVCRAEDDLNVAATCRPWPLGTGENLVRLYLDFFLFLNELVKTHTLHLTYTLPLLEVYTCVLKPSYDKANMLSLLIR
jgi:hypothetical protein